MYQMTPFDVFQSAMAQKAAADALVPGQVGYGVNPGTTGMLDSDPTTATNTDTALVRAQQSSAPIVSRPDADGGAGYSHPAPGVSPSMQMHADVKAAAVAYEAEDYANALYLQAKTAGKVGDALGAAKAHGAQVIAGAKSLGSKAQAVGQQAAGYAQQGAQMAQQGAAAAGQAFQGAKAQLGQARLNAQMDPTFGPMAQKVLGSPSMGDQVGYHAGRFMDGMQHAVQSAGAQAQAAGAHLQAGVREHAGRAQQAVSNAAQWAQDGVNNTVNQAAALAQQHPLAATGVAVGSVGAAAGGGVLAANLMAARQGQAQKQASVDEAAQMGHLFALQQLGLLQ